METMDAVISKSLAGRKLLLTLLGCFAGLALVLSAAGVYGVMSYAVTRRTREIGIRMAMGAGGAEVTSMILRDAGRLTALGITIGLAAAWAFSRVLTSMVYTVSPGTSRNVSGSCVLTV
jgi:ABC-type antimicrobial peptide transport system permease subunit